MENWISVNDRLPEQKDKDYQVVAICVKEYEVGNYAGEGIVRIAQDWNIRMHTNNYTHWMPLPEKPR